MKKLIAVLVLLLLAGCAAPGMKPVREQPTQLPIPTVPATPAALPEAPATNTCVSDCETQCVSDGEAACAQAPDYDACVASCGPLVRDGLCKGGCATGTPVECSIITSSCKKDCPKHCETA
ncbi:MAG TPA: hypothetical protein VLJ21_03935 [Candidatus Binatia bacterium]|nr:hypothetical protein [Candidatus Binatia bacterium]